MKFKLNGFEKFIIRNNKLLRIVIMVVYFFALCLRNDNAILGSALSTITLLALFYIFMLPSLKNLQLAKLNDVELNMHSFINGTTEILSVTDPKDLQNITAGCIGRIVALINVGDFDTAEQEIKLFWQKYDLKKVNLLHLVQTHTMMANIALEKGNRDLFESEMQIVYNYSKKPTMIVAFKHSYNHLVEDMQLLVEAYNATPNSNAQEFETRVFEHLNTNPLTGKPLKKLAKPMYSLMAYNYLFIFYKNQNNTEKATYYAQQVLNIGNEQIDSCRKAKEYIENENSSN